MANMNTDHNSGCIQSEFGCNETKCNDWCFFRQPDSDGNTWCIMCGNAGGANTITEPIDIIGTTLKERRTLKPAVKPAVTPIDILTVTSSPLEEEHEPPAYPVTVCNTVSPDCLGGTINDGSPESIITGSGTAYRSPPTGCN